MFLSKLFFCIIRVQLACVLLSGVLVAHVQAQTPKADSLKALLKNYPQRDTQYVNLLNATGMKIYSSNPEQTAGYGKKALELSQKLNYLKGIAQAYHTLGVSRYVKGKYAQAAQYYRKALNFYRKTNNRYKVASIQSNLGTLSIWQANYDQSIKHFMKAVTYFKSINDHGALANCYNSLGVVHKRRGDLNEAKKYYQLALTGFRGAKNDAGIASALINLGRISQVQGQWKQAIDFNFKALKIAKKTNNKRALSTCYHNIGEVKASQGKHREAIVYYQKTIDIEEEFKSLPGQAYTYNFLAESYRMLKEYQEAEALLKLSNDLAKKSKARTELKYNYLFQARLDSSQGKYLDAFEAYKQYTSVKDSLFNIQKSKQIARMQTQFKTKEKEQTILLLKEKERIQKYIIKRKNLWLGIIGLGLFSALALAYVWYRYYINKKKNNEQLQKLNYELNQHQDEIIAQHDFIEEQRDRLEEQHTKITKSLQAANHLQRATLPATEHVLGILPKHFIMYRPKDIVSGDFYWVEKIEAQTFVIMGDGTGHGVPGAFMALIATTLIDRIVKNWRVTEPAAILTMMHQEVRNILHQQDNDNQDGVDIGICVFTPKDKEVTHLTFAGARRPLLYMRPNDQEMQELKANRKSIGGFRKNNGTFDQHTVEVPHQTSFYLYTDGYSDQNNQDRRKFGQQAFREMLQQIYQQSCATQLTHLEKSLDEFMKDTEQRDDIAVIGWKI
ncbi:tetratricopeptide repeat protein [uncultured Microscilla sp.]|uniref:tetratricopeptide repeat protein n=1 Tax=uncultured Microscilla sp. TaxID=432653 RepID=UPI00262736CC|nr:tetratricopeptide repeat protein [uncultured Microscilla sp.]